MKIALLQTNPQSKLQENFQKSVELMRTAAQKGAKLIMCPETFLFMGHESERKRSWPMMNQKILEQFQLIAREMNIYLVLGSIDEILDTTEKAYNTCMTIAPNGNIIAKYRKLHLFNLFDENGREQYCESNVYHVGQQPHLYQIHTSEEIWDACNIICYDVRFPEMIRNLPKPCDVIFVPAAFTWQTGQDHWEVLLRARAIENQCFVVACNQTGFSHEGQKRCYGHSMVIDPWGKIIACLEETEDILFCEISKSDILKSRAKLPALKDRKIFSKD